MKSNVTRLLLVALLATTSAVAAYSGGETIAQSFVGRSPNADVQVGERFDTVKIDEGIVFAECFGAVSQHPEDTMVRNQSSLRTYKIDNDAQRIYFSDRGSEFVDLEVYEFYSDDDVLHASYQNQGEYGSVEFHRYQGLVEHEVLHNGSGSRPDTVTKYLALCSTRKTAERSGRRF